MPHRSDKENRKNKKTSPKKNFGKGRGMDELIIKTNSDFQVTWLNDSAKYFFKADKSNSSKKLHELIHIDHEQTKLIDRKIGTAKTGGSQFVIYYPGKNNTQQKINWTITKIDDSIICTGIPLHQTDGFTSSHPLFSTNLDYLIDLLPEIIFEVDSNFKLKFLNNTAYSILGYSANELLAMEYPDKVLFPEPDRELMLANFKKILKGKKSAGNIYKLINKHKQTLNLELHSVPIYKDNEIIGVRGIGINVTEKHKLRKILEMEKEKYEEIIKNAPIIYQLIDEDGYIRDINPGWQRLTGHSKNEILGRHFSEVLHPDYREKFVHRLPYYVEKGEIMDVQYKVKAFGDNDIDISMSLRISDQLFKNKKLLHCTLKDITLQKKAESTLIESEKRLIEINSTKDKFFSIIAHDLKNPFNDLIGFAQLLSMNVHKYDKEKLTQFSNIILDSSRRGYNLLENLLEWSRSQTGTLKFHPARIGIKKLVVETIEAIEQQAKKKDIKLENRLDGTTQLFIDQNMMKTVIRNLLTNSIKYSDPKGKVLIEGVKSNNHYQIRIQDDGVGIKAKDIDKLFRIDQSYSTEGTANEKGTGLGLVLSKEFVERNKGKIWVESEYGKGSTFFIRLPLPEGKS